MCGYFLSLRKAYSLTNYIKLTFYADLMVKFVDIPASLTNAKSSVFVSRVKVVV